MNKIVLLKTHIDSPVSGYPLKLRVTYKYIKVKNVTYKIRHFHLYDSIENEEFTTTELDTLNLEMLELAKEKNKLMNVIRRFKNHCDSAFNWPSKSFKASICKLLNT